MFKKVLFALALILPQLGMAAEYVVKAAAVDSTGTAEMYVTWRVFAQSDSIKPVAGAVTGEDGLISGTLAKPGKYSIQLTGMEGGTARLPFEVTDAKPIANLGKVVLETKANRLAEITVTAQKPLVTKEIDRIGYDVSADADAKTSPVVDILRKVPMVSIDAEGNIKVNGSSDFKIYKNGRPNNTLSSNAKEIFKSLPASSIKKIEVITDPGAREDAEGVGAILNIVTDSSTGMKGVMGSARLSANNRNPVPMPFVWLTTQVGNVTASVNAGTYYSRMGSSKYDSESEFNYATTGNTQRSYSTGQNKFGMGYGNIEASWEPDTLNLVTFEAGMYGNGSKGWNESSDSMTDALGNTLYSYNTRSTNHPSSYLSMNLGANYQRTTRRKDETITLSYRFSNDRSNSESESHYLDADNMPVPYTGTYNDNVQRFFEHTFQVDWGRPFGKNIKADFGSKYIRRINHTKTDLTYFEAPDMDNYTDYVHNTDVFGVYADARGKWGNFSARAGFRYEYSHMESKFKVGKGDNYGVSLNDWVPNISLSWNASQSSTLKVTYNRRISRPGMWSLNPAVIESVNSTSQGNPDLHSQTFDSFQFNYNLIKSKFNLDGSISYRFSTDAIAPTRKVVGDHIYSSYANCGHNRSLNASLWSQWSPGSKTQLSFNLGWGLQKAKYPQDGVELTRPEYDAGLNLSQKLPLKISLTLYGGWWSGWMSGVYGYSKSETNGVYYGLRMQRSFLKEDRLTVGASVQNPFLNRTYGYNYTVNSDYTGYTRSNNYTNTRFSLDINFRFGSLQAYVKKTRGSISNDDLSSGGGSGGGGGESGGGR